MPETYGMTPPARSLLDFIQRYHTLNRVMPTFDEMRIHLGLASKSGVQNLIYQLEDRGHIVRLRGRSRAITLQADTASSLVSVPAELRDGLLLAAEAAERTPNEHVAALIRQHCRTPRSSEAHAGTPA